MNVLALLLVLASAFLHASWNLLLKKANDRLSYVWWYLLVPLVLFSPMAVLTAGEGSAGLPLRSIGCGTLSGVLQAGCLIAVAWAYSRGDLSVVYPLSRGSAQVLIVALGVGLLGEQITGLGLAGVGLVFVGVYVVFLPSLSGAALLRPFRRVREPSSRAALAAGLAISLYHLSDRVGVQGANPYQYVLLLFGADFAAFTLFLAVRGRWDLVRAEWRANRASIVLAGVLSLLSYLLVLHALSYERVAYVGPARNVGIVFSVCLGALFLKERHGPMRLIGSVLIVAGLALAGAAG